MRVWVSVGWRSRLTVLVGAIHCEQDPVSVVRVQLNTIAPTQTTHLIASTLPASHAYTTHRPIRTFSALCTRLDVLMPDRSITSI